MYQFLGIIQKKEQTGASIFGDANERIFGGQIGDVVVRDTNTKKAIILSQHDWQTYQDENKPKKQIKKEEIANV